MRAWWILFAAILPLVAAGIGGKWDFVWNTEGGERRSTISFSVSGDSLKVEFPGAKAHLAGRIDGKKLTVSGKLYSPEAGEDGDFSLTGTVDEDKMTGEASWNEHRFTFRASRAK